MQCKLDWFSFTFPISPLGEKDNEYTLSHLLLAFHDHTAHRFLGVVTDSLWSWLAPVGFYRNRIQCPRTGCEIHWSGDNAYALFQASGQAVEKLLTQLDIKTIALSSNGRATRMDFAIDFVTDVPPSDFAERRDSGRIRASGRYTSETGETCYVGSRSGDRMARVYRYNPPHPRAHLLRAEVELKGDAAKIACDELTRSELTKVCLQAHLPFGWQHPLWRPGEAEISKLPARAYDREGAGTLLWLDQTVVPAIKKASEKGLINLSEWLTRHFPDEMSDSAP